MPIEIPSHFKFSLPKGTYAGVESKALQIVLQSWALLSRVGEHLGMFLHPFGWIRQLLVIRIPIGIVDPFIRDRFFLLLGTSIGRLGWSYRLVTRQVVLARWKMN